MDVDLKLPKEFKYFINPENRIKYYSNNPLKVILIKSFFKKIIEEIKATEPLEILEIGPGDGISGYLLSKNIKPLEYYAGDINKSSLVNASQILTKNLVIIDAQELPFSDKSFDLVVCLEVFEHIINWQKVFYECIRVCKKTLVFSVPLFPWYQLSNLVFLKNLSRMGEHPDHLVKFPFSKLKKEVDGFCKELILNQKILLAFPWAIVVIKINDPGKS